ncbi:MAG: SufD family Fe-S cluster assembly protein [Rickettsiales bacterium]|jgi:hypothetical protein|nr:SufD family Fe-S cluster assembly protein [Rickettsiales bacterium]
MYLWEEFNIKTFPAETIVFRDGFFQKELSTIRSPQFITNNQQSIIININKFYRLPIHIIYIDETRNQNNLEIHISNSDDQQLMTVDRRVFLTAKLQNKNPAFLNVFIKNTGENSRFKGKILCQNFSTLEAKVCGRHLEKNTGIIIETKIIAHSKSFTKLTGAAEVEKNCTDCDSDISFSTLAASDAKIEFFPAQFIRATPLAAEHSAYIYKGTKAQTEYLREAGLSGEEVKEALTEAFINS